MVANLSFFFLLWPRFDLSRQPKVSKGQGSETRKVDIFIRDSHHKAVTHRATMYSLVLTARLTRDSCFAIFYSEAVLSYVVAFFEQLPHWFTKEFGITILVWQLGTDIYNIKTCFYKVKACKYFLCIFLPVFLGLGSLKTRGVITHTPLATKYIFQLWLVCWETDDIVFMIIFGMKYLFFVFAGSFGQWLGKRTECSRTGRHPGHQILGQWQASLPAGTQWLRPPTSPTPASLGSTSHFGCRGSTFKW